MSGWPQILNAVWSSTFWARGCCNTGVYAGVGESCSEVQECSNAKKAETIVYENVRDYYGCERVRGAGHTRRFPDPEPRSTTSKRRRESTEQGEPDAC